MRDDHIPPAEELGFIQIRRDVLLETIHHVHMNISGCNGKPEVSFIRLSNKREQMKEVYEGDIDRSNYSNPFTIFGSLSVSAYGVVLVA
jgi:hypothetical protein